MASTDQTLDALIRVARDVSAPSAKRHQAFAEIVRRFQDLALACARAKLRDPALAEDAAQDAFLVAWERLEQLRETAAFPGWIRRLVLTQCHRRLRAERLDLQSDSEWKNIPAATPTAANVEAADAAALVRLTLAQLGPADRLVLILFYGSGCTHREIADWLSVPVTTVARRLAHAKRRMRGYILRVLSGGLRMQRQSAGQSFVVELSGRLRSASLDDEAEVCSLASRLGDVSAPRSVPAARRCAYLVEDPGSRMPIAYAAAAQTIFSPIYDLHLVMGEDALKRHAGDLLLAQIVQDTVASGAITLQHRTSARHGAVIKFLTARGFQIIRRAQDWRLGPHAVGPRAAPVPGGARWEFTTVDELSRDLQRFEAALELLTDAAGDHPSAATALPIHPDTLRRALRMQRDGVLAIIDGTLHGLLTASTDDVVPGALRLNLVAVRKCRRREGIATAMLAHLLGKQPRAQARLVAPEAPQLGAWLTGCGFVQVADTLVLERLLRKTVEIPPRVLDEYVGVYVAETPPGATILIERHGGSLISKSRDMRDVLLAASESEFFTRHHHTRGRFERNESGLVTRLVCTEGARQFVAIRQ
jgi:RNA polymerase sigma factor (sigma-70 family)